LFERADNAGHGADPPHEQQCVGCAGRDCVVDQGRLSSRLRHQRRADTNRSHDDVGDHGENKHRRQRGDARGRAHEQGGDRELKRDPGNHRIEAVGIEGLPGAGFDQLQPGADAPYQDRKRQQRSQSDERRIERPTPNRSAHCERYNTPHACHSPHEFGTGKNGRLGSARVRQTLYQAGIMGHRGTC